MGGKKIMIFYIILSELRGSFLFYTTEQASTLISIFAWTHTMPWMLCKGAETPTQVSTNTYFCITLHTLATRTIAKLSLLHIESKMCRRQNSDTKKAHGTAQEQGRKTTNYKSLTE